MTVRDNEAESNSAGYDLASVPESSTHIIRLNLSHQIAAKLRDEIVHGLIPPGTHLVQKTLCERFGTSRMPVRDALQQLAHEGLLVEHAGQREVVALGKDSLIDAHMLVAVLHGYAARRATELSTDEEFNHLELLYGRALEATDPLEFSQLAWPCHRYINFLARSPRLVNTIGTLQRAVPRVFPMSISDEMDSTKVRYREILTAMQGRDPALAESLVRDLAMDLAQWLMALLDGDSSFPSVDPFQARQNAY